MSEIERRKFKRQYDEEDFATCMRDPDFQRVWETGTLEEAGLVATNILKGEARTRKESREKNFLYRVKKEYR
jgi:hypothetical protein